jgi:hypothetical protein
MPQALRAQRLDRDAQALLRWFNLAPRLYEQTSLLIDVNR